MDRRRHESSNSLFNKLLVWMVGLALAILLASSFWTYLSVAKIYTSSRLESGEFFVKGLALGLGDKLLTKDYSEIESILKKAFLNKDLILAAVSDLDGRRIVTLKRDADSDRVELIFDSTYLPHPDIEHIKTKIEDGVTGTLQLWCHIDAGAPSGWLYLEMGNSTEGLILENLKKNITLASVVVFAILSAILLVLNRRYKEGILLNEGLIKSERNYWNSKAFEDPLTKLPNRLALTSILKSAIQKADEKNNSLGVLFLDLDGFKNINDKYGHKIGDALLIEFSKRLSQLFRAEDEFARYGGDEFLVICKNIDSKEQLEALVDRVLRELNAPYDLGGFSHTILASIGIALYPNDSGNSANELIARADQAMYVAKESGKNCYHFYS